MSEFINTPYLTDGFEDKELVRQINKTVRGMAHFAATGPFGTECRNCCFYGYHRVFRNAAGDAVKTVLQCGRCKKFHELTGEHGPSIPANTASCKYFAHRGKR